MNQDWKQLKLASNGIPSYDAFYPYVLYVLSNGEEATKNVVIDRVINYLNIPEEITEITYDNNPSIGVAKDRIAWALSYLYKAGAVSRPRRAIYQITESGLNLLNTYGEDLDGNIVTSQPAYIDRQKKVDTWGDAEEEGLTSTPELTPEAELDLNKIITRKNNEVKLELLDRILEMDSDFFEELVVDLLVKMGYSGKDGKAEITQRTNDGGVDGIINQDPLGTSKVYIQAKRFKEGNVVSRPAIQSFYGALAGVKADRGVLITTSTFSSGAADYAKSQGIVLIDGEQLTSFMLQYGVGVIPAEKYVVYEIDGNYFEVDV